MRIKPLLFVVFAFILTFMLIEGFCASGEGPLSNRVIVIDPGHGGIYPGAVHNGVREADVNLSAALKLRDMLVMSGAAVILTRYTDTNLAAPGRTLAEDLQARVDVAKNANADIFVSLHSNADKDNKMVGAISFYASGRSNDLARAVQEALVRETGGRDGGVRPANFFVLRNNEIPSALIEMGFLTNPEEAACLADETYQSKVAAGIYNGINNYFQCRYAAGDSLY